MANVAKEIDYKVSWNEQAEVKLRDAVDKVGNDEIAPLKRRLVPRLWSMSLLGRGWFVGDTSDCVCEASPDCACEPSHCASCR
jgi:hypothetical protein